MKNDKITKEIYRDKLNMFSFFCIYIWNRKGRVQKEKERPLTKYDKT